MKQYILIVTGFLTICIAAIELFYEDTTIGGNDFYVEDDIDWRFDVPIFDMSLDSTAELSPQVKHILGLYIPCISSEVEDTCFAIDLRVSRQSNQLFDLSVKYAREQEYEDGVYCGASKYKGHVVRLWGENIDNFWTTTSSPVEIQPDSSYIALGATDDQCSWWLCIDMDSQKIRPDLCSFFCGFPYSNDTLVNLWSSM